MNLVLQLLTHTKQIILNPENWCQDRSYDTGYDKNDKEVYASDPTAVKCTLSGAIIKAAVELEETIKQDLQDSNQDLDDLIKMTRNFIRVNIGSKYRFLSVDYNTQASHEEVIELLDLCIREYPILFDAISLFETHSIDYAWVNFIFGYLNISNKGYNIYETIDENINQYIAVYEIIRQVRHLLEDKKCWTRNRSKDSRNRIVDHPLHENTSKWSLLDAIYYIAKRYPYDIIHNNVAYFLDHAGRNLHFGDFKRI